MTDIDRIIREVSLRSPFRGPPRDAARIGPVLEAVREAWAREPDIRLLQLLVNAVPGGGEPVPNLFHLEDARLEGILLSRLGRDDAVPERRHGEPRDPARIDRMIEILREAWTREPDTRLFQLLVNVAPVGRAPVSPVPHLYHMEDARLVRFLAPKPDAAPGNGEDGPEEIPAPGP